MTLKKSRTGEKSSGDEKRQESTTNKRVRDLGERRATSGKQIGLMRSARLFGDDGESLESVESIVHPSTAPEVRRSLDVVVVDVHSNENKERSEKSLAARKLFKRRNPAEDAKLRIEAFSKNEEHRKRELKFEQGNAWEIQESIDSIREFEETNKVLDFDARPKPVIERISNSPETRSLRRNFGGSNSLESLNPQLFESSEKLVPNSQENSGVEGKPSDSKFVEEPKRRRKRWTKNQNNLNLTQELIANSSDTNQSGENDSRFSNAQRIKPVPAPRRKREISRSFARESLLAFDNAAYKSDTEEVLRIETEVYETQGTPDGAQNLGQRTKIEMTNLYESKEKVSDRDNEGFDSGDESAASLSSKDNRRSDKIETLKSSVFPDASEDTESEICRVTETEEDSKVLYSPSKSREQSSPGSDLESSELSEEGEESNESKKRSKRDKRTRRDRVSHKRESVGFNTGNSLTDISELPRSKSRREVSRKSKSRELRDSEKRKAVRKRGQKRGVKDESENDLIECNAHNEEKFISVTIHKANVLKTDFITRHPMVKIHIVDTKSGNYLKKTDSDSHGKCDYLQPLITGKFDFRENRSIVPNWEEELIFEYNFDEIIQPSDKSILILFEIIDLLNFAEASFNYNVLGNEGCWHRIAWAFLRPVGVNGTLHMNKKLRLQLYEPCKISRKSGRPAKCEVFNWWRSSTREKYPSTLYVTLKSVDPPIQEPILYDHLSFSNFTELETESFGSCKKSSDLIQLPKWKRLAAQSCKIPNDHLFETETFENGSFHLTFSNNGKYLACVGSDDGNYPIFVYAIPEGKILAQFIGHANFVYSLSWSNDDKYLLSVSSDQTACIWDMENQLIQHIQMLPHPSYVYCGKFYPGTRNVVITGCYDCVARVWTKSKSSKRYELTQELYEHKGYVNSLCFQKDGGLITADSVGVIVLWKMKKRGGVSPGREWRLLKIIRNNEIQNVVINTVVLHPLGSRLLVHSRDNGLRMIDLETGVVLQRYKGLRNRRVQANACLSPCGGLVLCGGEDSCLTLWSLENGRRLAKYLIKEAKIVSCVDYHPLDHILAFSTFGSVSSVRIINFEKNSTGENVGLSLLVDSEVVEDSDGVEITMKFDKNDPQKNLSANYSRGTTASASKRGERFNTEGNKSFKTFPKSSMEEMSKDTKKDNSVSRQKLLKLKIQRLNESEEGLKSRSAARLNNIIEKIDRILVNTTMKKDSDSTCSFNDTRRKNLSKDSSNSRRDSHSKSRYKAESRSWRSRSRDSTSNTDAMMEAYNESMELIEMKNVRSARSETSENGEFNNSSKNLSRSKSRAATTVNISSRSEELESEEEEEEEEEERVFYKSSSESNRKESSKEKRSDVDVESNREKKTTRRKKRKRKEKLLSGFSDEKLVIDTENCIIDLENMKMGFQSNPSASDSAGTYTIDKEKFPKSGTSDKSKVSDASSSAKSNATFTIENEISSAK